MNDDDDLQTAELAYLEERMTEIARELEQSAAAHAELGLQMPTNLDEAEVMTELWGRLIRKRGNPALAERYVRTSVVLFAAVKAHRELVLLQAERDLTAQEQMQLAAAEEAAEDALEDAERVSGETTAFFKSLGNDDEPTS
jgi:hypothetical protein